MQEAVWTKSKHHPSIYFWVALFVANKTCSKNVVTTREIEFTSMTLLQGFTKVFLMTCTCAIYQPTPHFSEREPDAMNRENQLLL